MFGRTCSRRIFDAREAPQEIFEFLQNENIPIEVLVNNAGFGLGGEFSETAVERELEMIQVNIVALTHLTKLFLAPMIKRKSGRVLNVASTAAFQPGPLMAVYYATKAYVLSFSEALSEELRNTDVTVTALCPGPRDTDFADTAEMGESRLFNAFGIADADDVAKYGYDAMMSGKRLAIPGIKNKILAQANRLAPRALSAKIARIAQENRAKAPAASTSAPLRRDPGRAAAKSRRDRRDARAAAPASDRCAIPPPARSPPAGPSRRLVLRRSALRPEIDDPVGELDDVEVVLDQEPACDPARSAGRTLPPASGCPRDAVPSSARP